MILCPVALATGRKSCFMFRICPTKGIIGDYKKGAAPPLSRSHRSAER